MVGNLVQQLNTAGFKRCRDCAAMIKAADRYCRHCGASRHIAEPLDEKEIIQLFDPQDYYQYSTLPQRQETKTTARLHDAPTTARLKSPVQT